MATYTFGDTDVATERLARLARVFAPASRPFLAAAAPDPCSVAVDVGCGPGFSTSLLAEVSGAHRVVGLDQSLAFAEHAAARFADAPTVSTGLWDLTSGAPMPAPPASLVWTRFVLAHLPDVADALERMAAGLAPGGVLAVDELEAIETTDATFCRYLTLATELVASRGAMLAAGPLVARTADPGGCTRVHDEVVTHDVAFADAATMFAMNLRTWREDPYIVGTRSPEELDELAEALQVRRETDDTVTWQLRQVAWRRPG